MTNTETHTLWISNGSQTETMSFTVSGEDVVIFHKWPNGQINNPNAKGVGRHFTRTKAQARKLWAESKAVGWKVL